MNFIVVWWILLWFLNFYFIKKVEIQGNIPVNIVVSNAMVLQTFLVTGGWDSNEDVLASTELLAEGSASWVRTGELPTPRSGLTGAHIDGRILMAGNK